MSGFGRNGRIRATVSLWGRGTALLPSWKLWHWNVEKGNYFSARFYTTGYCGQYRGQDENRRVNREFG